MPRWPSGTMGGGHLTPIDRCYHAYWVGTMLFHVITNVWGERHTALFLRMALPNLLSPGNLPALAGGHNVRYRIYTTPADRACIEASEPGKELARLMPLEFVTPLGEVAPDPFYHVHWFHRAAAEAKRHGAVAVFVAPDALWSDGTFKRCGEVMELGFKAISIPFLQVVAETCVPEALERFGGQADGSIRIPAEGLYELGRCHLHPLTALAMPNSPHGRPGLDMHWPVQGEGILSRYIVRELFALDPRRCPITFLWYAGGEEDREGIYVATGPQDMAMLSVDPLDKYFVNYIVGHTVKPGDLVRSTLHPWNVKDQNQTRVFTRRRIYWHGVKNPSTRWRRAEARSDLAMREAEVKRTAQLLWAQFREIGCHRAAGILALALEATPLARRWREDLPLTVFVPTDAALGYPMGSSRIVRQLATGPMVQFKHLLRRIAQLLILLFRSTGCHRIARLIELTFEIGVLSALKRVLRRILGRAAALLQNYNINRVAWVLTLMLEIGAVPALKRVIRRIAHRLLELLREIGCERFADILTREGKRLARDTQNVDTLAPLEDSPESHELWEINRLQAVGAERELMRMLRRHVVAGEVGRVAGQFLALDGSEVDIVIEASKTQVDGVNVVGGPFVANGITVWLLEKSLAKPTRGTSP